MFVLLLVVAIACLAAGLLVGRYYVPDDRGLRRQARHAKRYVDAIDSLLSRDTSAAIDQLRRVVEDNVSDIEPYFALGALFRSRGEWERAIRVHQAIELRSQGDRAAKRRVRYELGLDFRAAGMPRRATLAFEDCVTVDPTHGGALRALCGLYEEQGRYAEAATVWGQVAKIEGERSPRESHLLAAAAQRALAAGAHADAERLLSQVNERDRGMTHVLAARAELAHARGDLVGASELLADAVSSAPATVHHFVPALVAVERQRSAAEASPRLTDDELDAAAARRAADVLIEVLEGADPPHSVELAIAELKSRYDAEAAMADFRDVARRYPDLLPARVAAARIALGQGESAEIAEQLMALAGEQGALAWVVAAAWRCSFCGHRGDEFLWRCPSCRHWDHAVVDQGSAAGESMPSRERRKRPRNPSDPEPTELDRGLPDTIVAAPSGARRLRAKTVPERATEWLSGIFNSASQDGD